MPRLRTRKPSAKANEGANELRLPASGGFQTLGKRRRSVRENAPLQNQLSERGRAGRPDIAEIRDAFQLPIIEGVNVRNKIVDEQTCVGLDFRRLNRNGHSRAQRFAAGRLLIAAVGLSRRRLVSVTMRYGFSSLRFDRTQEAMIRNREPCHHRQHDEEKPGDPCGLATHDSYSISPNA